MKLVLFWANDEAIGWFNCKLFCGRLFDNWLTLFEFNEPKEREFPKFFKDCAVLWELAWEEREFWVSEVCWFSNVKKIIPVEFWVPKLNLVKELALLILLLKLLAINKNKNLMNY